MTITHFLRLLQRNLLKMIIAGLIAAALVYWSVKDEKPVYKTQTVLNTGLVSGYSLDRSSGGRIDLNYTNNEISNLLNLAMSNEMTEELCLRLMARYFTIKLPNTTYILPENQGLLDEAFSPSLISELRNKANEADAYAHLLSYRNQPGENELKELLYSDHPFFGNESVQKILAKQVGGSDMILVKYETVDPGVCQQTVQMHTEILVRKKLEDKQGQFKNVLGFFEEATEKSAADLAEKEDELLAFTVENKIINYYEQTRYIAAEKEDLDDNYFRERMDRASADSTVRRLESELAGKVSIPQLNKLLVSQREELERLSAQMARLQTNAERGEETESGKLGELQRRAEVVRSEMRKSAESAIASQTTTEGVDTKEVLTQWLNRVLDKETSKARLDVFKQRRSEFDETYSRFAPWGSKLKRLEREIDVRERAYLENLHSFNQAKLQQYNMLISGGLKVVDPPPYPAKPEKMKGKMVVVAAMFVAMLLVLALAVAMHLFDATLKSPAKSIKITGLQLAGAVPDIRPRKTNRPYDLDLILERSLTQMYQTLLAETQDRPDINSIAVVSLNRGEGKSFITFVAQQMHSMFRKTHQNTFSQITFFELPALLDTTDSNSWNTKADINLLVCGAEKRWSAAHQRAVENFQKQNTGKTLLVLNLVEPEYLDEIIGEVPRERSPLRKGLKSLLNRFVSKG